MKVLLYVLAASLYLASRGQSGSAQFGNLLVRPRVGHLKEKWNLFKEYVRVFDVFKENRFKEKEDEKLRRFQINGEDCMNYLQNFRASNYRMSSLQELIMLDSCLGYLYESEFHDNDIEASEIIRDNLQSHIDDPMLKEIYTGTNVINLSDMGMACLTNLLYEYILTFEKNHGFNCGDDWMNVFDNFANCHGKITGTLDIEQDSYLKPLHGFLRDHGKTCFMEQAKDLQEMVESHYKDLTKISHKIFASSEYKIWPMAIVKLLRVVQGDENKLNLKKISEIVAEVGRESSELSNPHENTFVKNIADRIDKTLIRHLKPTDGRGSKIFKKWVDELCECFRSGGERYDFRRPFVNMAHMLRRPEIFGATNEHFLNYALTGNEHRGLYLSVASCEYLDHIEVGLKESYGGSFITFIVDLKNVIDMVQWPDISIESI